MIPFIYVGFDRFFFFFFLAKKLKLKEVNKLAQDDLEEMLMLGLQSSTVPQGEHVKFVFHILQLVHNPSVPQS